jgi:hypothetical protein
MTKFFVVIGDMSRVDFKINRVTCGGNMTGNTG